MPLNQWVYQRPWCSHRFCTLSPPKVLHNHNLYFIIAHSDLADTVRCMSLPIKTKKITFHWRKAPSTQPWLLFSCSACRWRCKISASLSDLLKLFVFHVWQLSFCLKKKPWEIKLVRGVNTVNISLLWLLWSCNNLPEILAALSPAL